MKYKIVSNVSSWEVEENVERYLNEGYKLYGNISVIPVSGNRAWYTQTLVKEDDNETMLTENQVDDILRSHCTEGIIEVGVDKK